MYINMFVSFLFYSPFDKRKIKEMLFFFFLKAIWILKPDFKSVVTFCSTASDVKTHKNVYLDIGGEKEVQSIFLVC